MQKSSVGAPLVAALLWIAGVASGQDAGPLEPEAEAGPEPEAEPEAETVPEAAPEPEPEPEAKAEAKAEAETVAVPKTEAARVPVPQTETAPGEAAGLEEAPEELPEYGAVAVVPAPGSTLSLRKVPRNVQYLSLEVFDQTHPSGVHEALDARLGSVVLNDVQNNPLQPDLQYRGFTASPLLGSPQGVAVYQNGVRLNEPFGDVVQWDLLPQFAVREVHVMPGASPLYGLNALGGSVALRMKDGFRNPGHRVTALGGSFGRHRVSAESGRIIGDGWAAFAGASSFGEQGFRDESQSRALHGFADLRHRAPELELGASLTLAHSNLNGNGLAPVELLARDGRDAVFTYPDNTENDLLMLGADLDHQLSTTLSVQALAYLRGLRRDTLNGDEGEFGICAEDMASFVCEEGGELVTSETGGRIASTMEYDGLFNTTHTVSDGYGASLQLTHEGMLLSGENQLIAGASYDGAHVGYLQRAELGLLTRDRSVIGQNHFLGGDEFRTKLDSHNRMLGVYATDTFSPADALSVNLSARANWVNVELDDREGVALDGDHTFVRVNPALGVAYSPLEALTVFASYSEANRAPSAAELACADPDEPCRLPNAFVADPPLEQVVTRAVELGLRGHVSDGAAPVLTWSMAGFGSRNFDDIIFVAGSRVGTGYFRNAGETQRIGLEASLSGGAGPIAFHLGYQLLRATFEDELSLPAPETEEDDEEVVDGVDVEPGDRIPGLPLHNLKAGIEVRPVKRLRLGLSMNVRSSIYFRGDEGNDADPVDGYIVVDAHASYDVFEALQIFVKARNLLDSDYDTFGLLANPAEVLPGTSDPRFVSPGPPLGVWAGIVLHD